MTTKEVKVKLGCVYARYREYQLAEEKCEQFKGMISLPAPSAGSDVSRSENSDNPTENRYVAALWYSEEVGRRFRKYMLARQEAEDLINNVKFFDEKEVLTRRYLMFEKWDSIADKMHFSKARIFQLNEAGIKSISETL